MKMAILRMVKLMIKRLELMEQAKKRKRKAKVGSILILREKRRICQRRKG
jgi:hypothetical protein